MKRRDGNRKPDARDKGGMDNERERQTAPDSLCLCDRDRKKGPVDRHKGFVWPGSIKKERGWWVARVQCYSLIRFIVTVRLHKVSVWCSKGRRKRFVFPTDRNTICIRNHSSMPLSLSFLEHSSVARLSWSSKPLNYRPWGWRRHSL